MQLLRTVLVSMVVVAQTIGGSGASLVLVKDVVNGHTIVVQGIGRVPLAGIRAPAIGRAIDPDPLGARARQRLLSLVGDRYVRLEFASAMRGTTDHRGPAFVVLEDGTFVNAVLVREGLARTVGHGTSARERELQGAEATARDARRGIWGGR